MLEAFKIRGRTPEMRGGRAYWRASVKLGNGEAPLKIIIGVCAEAGTVTAALRTVRFFQDFTPSLFVLAGIAAGQRGKYQIGNVVYGVDVADLVMGQVEGGKTSVRPLITSYTISVGQILSSFKPDLSALHKLTLRILKNIGHPLARPADAEKGKLFDRDVASSSKVKDCVIGSGNLLVRDQNKFPEYQSIHPKISAIEMEAAGMVRALKEIMPGQAWLVVRGISDFGDEDKDKAFDGQPYAAAGAAAYVKMLAEKGFVRVMLGRTLPVAAVVTSTATALPVLTSAPSIARLGASSVAAASDPSSVSNDDLEKTLAELRREWARAPSPALLAKIEVLRDREIWTKAKPEIRGRAVRFELELFLAGSVTDLEKARTLHAEAQALSGPDRALAARVELAASGPKQAAELVVNPRNLDEWNTRMALLVESDQIDLMLEEWERPPDGVGPDAESRRVHVLALISRKQLEAAALELSTAQTKKPESFALRYAGALLNYFTAISPAAPDTLFVINPLPIPSTFLRRDSASLQRLNAAAAEFTALSSLVSNASSLYGPLQLWRFASLANHADRQSEASELCRELLSADPGHPLLLQWAAERRYETDKETQINALAGQLGVEL